MTIFLVRHGETRENAARVVQLPDVPLDSHGAIQAERLARRLAGAGITAILSSDLTRAVMTAERLAAAIATPVTLDALLRERDYGDIRGLPYAEVGTDIFAPDYAPPGGETWATFHARVDRAWTRILAAAAATAGHLAVVTHGLVCTSLATRHLELPPGAGVPARWANTALTVIDGPAPWRVRLLNDATHLDADSADDSGSRSGA